MLRGKIIVVFSLLIILTTVGEGEEINIQQLLTRLLENMDSAARVNNNIEIILYHPMNGVMWQRFPVFFSMTGINPSQIVQGFWINFEEAHGDTVISISPYDVIYLHGSYYAAVHPGVGSYPFIGKQYLGRLLLYFGGSLDDPTNFYWSEYWPFTVVDSELQLSVATEENIITEIPHSNFSLSQNYPNPFNSETTIEFTLPESSHITLKLYDLLGRELQTLVDECQLAGVHKVRVEGNSLPAGVYTYHLLAGDFIASRKMILIK